METANRRNAAMAMSSLPRFAGGWLIEGFKKAIGITPESPELDAYRAEAAKRAGMEIAALEALSNVDRAKVDVYRARIEAFTWRASSR